jgi:predicted N-acyltransferase
MAMLEPLCKNQGMFKTVSYPGTHLFIYSKDIEEYYKRLKSSRRHNLRKKLKRSKEYLKADAEIIQHPSADVLEEVFQLFWQTYEKGDTKFERLNPKFFELIAKEDVSWFILLRDQESKRLVGFMLCFNLGQRIINKFIGLDYSIAESTYLYFRLWEAALEWAISMGAAEFCSGQTGYRAKIDVGNSLVPLINYCKHLNPVINKIYATIAKTISWSSLDKDLEVYLKAHPEENWDPHAINA